MNKPSIRRTFALAIAALFGLHTAVPAWALTLADKPVFASTTVPPNLVVTLDDSGSMRWAYAPDSLECEGNTRRVKSASYNPLYYNPAIKYDAPLNASGQALGTGFTQAWINGYDQSRGSRNLTSNYRPTWVYNPSTSSENDSDYNCNWGSTRNRLADNPAADFPGKTRSGVAAYYYVFDASLGGCNGQSTDDDCYRKVTVGSNSGPGTVDLSGDGVLDNADRDERQNFANWYSFYRTRNLATVGGAARAFADMDSQVRVAWQSLNSCDTLANDDTRDCEGWNGTTYNNRIRAFTNDSTDVNSAARNHRNDFYNWLFRLPASGGTPLRSALRRAGEYYKLSGLHSAYALKPHNTAGNEQSLACRQNFTIAMTDGIWNSDSISTYGNKDNTSQTAGDGTTSYTPRSPFKDSNSNSLADIAFHYWITDLRSDLANTVPRYPSTLDGGVTTAQFWDAKNDPANWQHMVTFTVGLGLTKSLAPTGLTWGGSTYTGSYAGLVAGTTTWPATGSDADGNVADLWHAAINGRGQFFSADDPDGLSTAFKAIVSRVQIGMGSAAAVAGNTTSLNSTSALYQAAYDGSVWTGDLKKYTLDSNGAVPATTTWNAASKLAAPDAGNRKIVTWNTATRAGVPFRWSDIAAAQQAQIKGTDTSTTLAQNRLDWVRGAADNEAPNGNGFRTRPTTKLGDVINSAPVRVAEPASGYPGSAYYDFRHANLSRSAVIYVGANDGMLHAFADDTGDELLAYVPSSVYGKFQTLSRTDYGHKFFVDGAPTSADVEINGAWKTVLVGGLNNGGRGIYALDITDPSTFAEANAASLVLWEFTSSDDADLGYTFTQPQVAKLQNGKWAAIFGNGYNATESAAATGKGVLYIAFIESGLDGAWTLGSDVIKLPVNAGTTGNPNGLATPLVADTDGDGKADAIYAGDLMGNLWKFDVSNAAPSNWAVAYSGAALFAAKDASSNVQPITTQPEAIKHPNGGTVVLFGTGQALQDADMNSANFRTQSFYGIRDDGTATVSGRGVLQAQTVTSTVTDSDGSFRIVSDNAVNWTSQKGWYLDFPSSSTSGERDVANAVVAGNAIVFVTAVPSGSQCGGGSDSWLWELEALTGRRLAYSAFDINRDGGFDNADKKGGNFVSGRKLTVGVGSTPYVMRKGKDERKYISGSTGAIEAIDERRGSSAGRLSWREIMQ